MIRIDYIIQHHPSRAELVKRLTCDLPDARLIVSDEDPPSPWAGYMKCLAAVRSGYSHACIIQDDTIACRNVPRALLSIAAAEPDVPICLFTPLLPMHSRRAAMEAGKEGRCFTQISVRDFLPVVAVLWPVPKTQEFLEWATGKNAMRHKNGKRFVERSDDAMGGRWMRNTQQRVLATIPSLIEHPDDAPSTIARKNANRTALFWKGQDWDATSVSWSY